MVFIILLCGTTLSSCQAEKKANYQILLNSSAQDKQILFFSDERNLKEEVNYYDALIELKEMFPKEVANMRVISQKETIAGLNITTYPTLIVIHDNQILKRIQGYLSKEEIIAPIEEALSHN
ncbi:hypothetical protein LCL95_02485 [Bacillus timonensis]|nr:hypothetical protein [Bacillus timonensis]